MTSPSGVRRARIDLGMADRDFLAEYESFEEVLERCASNISEEGIFLVTGQAGPVGSDMAFEIRIRDSFSVLRGEGKILQADEQGVFLSFAYLDQPSLKLLPKIVEHYRRHGVPLLELPEAAPEEPETEGEETVVEELAAEHSDEEADDVVEPPAVGLTLDDLEAEFLAEPESGATLPEEDVEAPPPERLLDAKEVLAQVDPSPVAPEGTEPAMERNLEELLVDPEELIADDGSVLESQEPDDIHLDALFSGEPEAADAAQEESPEPTGSVDEPAVEPMDRVLSVDAGLPWLPDEPDRPSRKGLWVIVAMILLGAILGAVFYFFVFSPVATSSGQPLEPPGESVAQASSADTMLEMAPVSAALADTGPIGQPVAAVDAAGPEAPVSTDQPGAESELLVDPLTGVDRVTWELESGQTVITFWADGRFVEGQVDDFRVEDGEPREVVRIRGIRRPFAQQQIELDTDHVRRLRVGFHREDDGGALHFVADLVDGTVELSRTESAGEQLRVYFSNAS